MSPPAPAPALTLKGIKYPLRWDYAAIYRLLEAGRQAAFEELSTPKGFKASVDLLWAMLEEGDAAKALPTDTPQALARAITAEGLSPAQIIELLSAALSEGERDMEVKKNATPSSLSPVSNSG